MDTLLERPTAGRTGRLAWADLLRVLTTFAVVLLHTSTTWLALAEEGSAEWTALMAWDGLTRWCVPVFVLLSGAFLLDPNKPLTVRFLLRGRLPRILAALLAWGFFYNLIYFRNAGAAGVRNACCSLCGGRRSITCGISTCCWVCTCSPPSSGDWSGAAPDGSWSGCWPSGSWRGCCSPPF